MRRSVFAILAICLWGLPSVAAAQDVYFSVGPAVRKLNLQNPNSTSLVYTSTAFVGDLAMCSDNYLYFVEKAPLSRISRMDLSASSPLNTRETVFSPTAAVREIRLTPTCNVLYATAAGVFQVSGKPPFSVAATSKATTGAGSGLAVAFDGSLRFSTISQIVGMNVGNGGQGSVSGMDSLPTGAVCASTANRVVCTDKAGTGLGSAATLAQLSSLAELPGLDKVQYCEFLTNDTMVCGASVDPESEISRTTEIDHNGTLQLITGVGAVSRIFAAPRVSNRFMPVVGVAVGPSNSEIVTSPATGTTTDHQVDYGPVSFDVVTPRECRLGIQLRQLTRAQALAKLASATGFSGNAYELDLAAGSESWIDDIDVTVKASPGPGPACGMSAATPATVTLYQNTDNAFSKAVLHCTGGSCKVVTVGNFPYWTSDPDSGAPDGFSDFMTAIVAPEDSSTPHPIVFSSPLNNAAIVPPGVTNQLPAVQIGAAPTFNGGVSIRFRICANAACTSFLPAEGSNFPVSGAGLSVTRFSNAGVPLALCDVEDNGGANPDRPIFRTADSTSHNFNFNSPPPGDSVLCGLSDLKNGERALFGFTVFSNGGTFKSTTILAWLQK